MTRSAYDAHEWLASPLKAGYKPSSWQAKGKGYQLKKKPLWARLFGF